MHAPCAKPHATCPCVSSTHHNFMQPYRIDYQPQLVEEAVLLAMRGHEDEHLFRYERNQVYERFPADERETAFQQLHQSWFDILKMNRPLLQCLDTWPLLREATQQCLVMKARAPKEAGAELYRAAESRAHGEYPPQTILIQLAAQTLTQPEAALVFFRHELLHIADMLDPRFEYAPNFPKSDAGPAHDHLLQNRYAVLWDVIIDGRLHQRGWAAPVAREKHFENFKRVFSGPEEKITKVFEHFFERNSHTHHELIAFAQRPEKWLQSGAAVSSARSRCALCSFPTVQLLAAEELRAEVRREIQAQFPAWHEAAPICRQCADLYEARLV